MKTNVQNIMLKWYSSVTKLKAYLHFASSTITIDQIKDNQIHIKSGAIKTVVTDESQTIQKNGKVVPKVMTQL